MYQYGMLIFECMDWIACLLSLWFLASLLCRSYHITMFFLWFWMLFPTFPVCITLS